MNIEILITGAIGLITTVVSSITSWVLARKKYYSEVDHNLIENMERSLDFYKKLSDDNRARLEEVSERNKALETELHELRKQVLNLTMNICMDLTCANRIRERQLMNRKSNGKAKDRLDKTEAHS